MKKLMSVICLISVLLLGGCSDKYVATVGDSKITESEFLFYLSSVKSQMSGTELQSDEDWQSQEIEGMKAIDFAKERALEAAVKNLQYVKVAGKMNIQLNDSEKAYINSTKESLIVNQGGEKAYEEYLKASGVSDEFINMLCQSMVYSSKLAEIAIKENPISDEEKHTMYEELSSNGNYKAKHILLSVVDSETRQPIPEEEKAEKKKIADDVLNKVNGGEDFDALMNSLSEDPGLATSPDGYVFSTGEMVPEFESCVASLEINEIGFAESEFGYHIIKRLPLEMTDLEDRITGVFAQEKLDDCMVNWESEFGLSPVKNNVVYDKIS